MNRSSNTIGSIELILAMMLSGTIGYFVISSGQDFWNVVFFRCVIGALVLGGYAYYAGLIRREYFQRSVLLMIILGGITLVGNWIFLFASFNYIPFSIATVAYHMQPLFLVITGALITKEKLSASLLFWLALAFIGLFLIVELDLNELNALFSGEASSDGSYALFGLSLALGAALLYTVTTLVTKKVSQVPSTFVALVQVVVGIFMLLPFADFDNLPTQTSQWMDLLILGAVLTGFMYIIMYDSFQKLPTSLIALLSFIYPITALFVDHLAFSTHISLTQILGVILILLAVNAVKFNWALPRKKPKKKNLESVKGKNMRQIKEVRADQADVLAHLIREANRAVAKSFGINQENGPKHPSFCERSWVENDFHRGERYFLLSENQQPIACVAYEIPTNSNGIRKAYLNRLSVLPEQQSKGIGSQLVAHIIEQAKADQLELISIGVIGEHIKLQDWYEQLGFVKVDTKHFDHLPFSVTYMMYDLNNQPKIEKT